jgi:hypothetical protein
VACIYLHDGGSDALLNIEPSPGGPSKFPAKTIVKLYGLISGHDPRQLHGEFALWTRDMVADFVEREFGVRLATTTYGRSVGYC